MSSYLAYSYSTCLTEEEGNKINEKVRESQKEFCRGANDGFKVGLTVYSIYLTTRGAHASDQCPPPKNSPVPAPETAVAKPKPGFKPLKLRQLGAATNAGGTICVVAIGSGDYLLGAACIGLVFAFLNIVN